MQLVHRLLSTRGGTFAVAGLSALLAAAALLVFLHRYRQTVSESTAPVTVLLAKSLIQKGTPGEVIASEDLFQVTNLRKSELRDGAFSDPVSLNGEIAASDIYPGQQLTATDFTKTTSPILSKLSQYDRAISIPLDSAHGLIGDVQTGDHVDLLAGFLVSPPNGKNYPVLRVLERNVLVLAAPASSKGGGLSGGGGSTQNVVLRLTDDQAAQAAFSSDNGKLWVVLRPQASSAQHTPSVITIDRLLAGVRPLPVSANGSRP